MIVVANLAMSAVMALAVEIAGWFPFLRHRPRLRHALWLLVLAKLVPWPGIPLPILPAEGGGLARAQSEASSIVASDVVMAVQGAIDHTRIVGTTKGSNETFGTVPFLSQEANRFAVSDCRRALLAAGFAATLFLIGRAWRQHRRAARLIECAAPAEARILKLAAEASRSMNVETVLAVRMIDGRMPPLLWLRRRFPTIVLPSALIARLDEDQIRCIVCHELAHYIRRDVWTSLFAFLASAVYWWNPVAWWGRRELLSAQEECCDALVLSKAHLSRKKYAETLLATIEFINAERPFSPVLASGFGRTFATRRRFEMIAESHVSRRIFGLGGPLVVLLGVAFLCIPVRGQATKEPLVPSPPSDGVPRPKPANPDGVILGTFIAQPPDSFITFSDFQPPDLSKLDMLVPLAPQRARLKFKDTADVPVDPRKHCLFIDVTPDKGCQNGTLRIDLEKGVTYTVRCSGQAFMSSDEADPYPGIFFGYQTDAEDCHAIRYAILKPGESITFTTPKCRAASDDVFAVAFFVQAWPHRTAPAQRGSYTLSFTRSSGGTPTSGLAPFIVWNLAAPKTYTIPSLEGVTGTADSKAFQEWHRRILQAPYKKIVNCSACHQAN